MLERGATVTRSPQVLGRGNTASTKPTARWSGSDCTGTNGIQCSGTSVISRYSNSASVGSGSAGLLTGGVLGDAVAGAAVRVGDDLLQTPHQVGVFVANERPSSTTGPLSVPTRHRRDDQSLWDAARSVGWYIDHADIVDLPDEFSGAERLAHHQFGHGGDGAESERYREAEPVVTVNAAELDQRQPGQIVGCRVDAVQCQLGVLELPEPIVGHAREPRRRDPLGQRVCRGGHGQRRRGGGQLQVGRVDGGSGVDRRSQRAHAAHRQPEPAFQAFGNPALRADAERR